MHLNINLSSEVKRQCAANQHISTGSAAGDILISIFNQCDPAKKNENFVLLEKVFQDETW